MSEITDAKEELKLAEILLKQTKEISDLKKENIRLTRINKILSEEVQDLECRGEEYDWDSNEVL